MSMSDELETISGEVLHVSYRNDESDWSVLVIRDARRNGAGKFSCAGVTNAGPGQVVTAKGKWSTYNGAPQFKADQITATNPTTPDGVTAYLSSGVIAGIGPAKAAALVKQYGVDILRILDEEPERLLELKGFGPATVERIKLAWEEQRQVRGIMLFLHSQNVPAALCKRIYRAWGDKAVDLIKADPFRLCLEIRGIGFKTADAIAQRLSIPKDSPQRIRAGMGYVMQEAVGRGHAGLLRTKFLELCAEALEIDEAAIAPILDADLTDQFDGAQLVQHEDAVYFRWLAAAEEFVCERLLEKAGLRAPWGEPAGGADALLAKIEGRVGMHLANKQRQAALMALRSRVCVISGGPGVGKTATTNVILAAMRAMDLTVALAAPTGKAAQRASEATGQQARTIHRLLGLKGGDSSDISPVQADVLLIDEMSMVDIPLMRHVMRGLKRRTALILVGDVDQLPSVGPGNVLGDIMRSGTIPVVMLDEVFRQAAGSLIIRNAHSINRGQYPEVGTPTDDFFMLTEKNTQAIRAAMSIEDEEAIPASVAEACATVIRDLVTRRLPAKFGFDPVRDIQVLSPMNKGGCGVGNLNLLLQEAVNPTPSAAVKRYGSRFGVGDKVLQTRNNYDLEIYNGDMGIVEGVNDESSTLTVQFDNRLVGVPYDDLDDMRLAYAMTIHKSQGSQAPVVIIPMVTQHWAMLQRNLIYTGVTRARKLVVLVGQSRAIAAAVRRRDAAQRITRLRQLLAGDVQSSSRDDGRFAA
jgi:exodeoxyribonuclease V alpha subunit